MHDEETAASVLVREHDIGPGGSVVVAVGSNDVRVRGVDGLWLAGDTTRARGVGIDKAARTGITAAEAVLGGRLPFFADTVRY